MTSAHVDSSTIDPVLLARHSIAGMDCARDAAEIERAVRAVPGVIEVKVSVASQVMTTRADSLPTLRLVEGAVHGLGYRLHPIESPTHDVAGESGAASLAPNVAPWRTSAYRQALGIVVLLNAGFGLLEGVGGVLARSQSLQADALDFLGDGLITGLAFLGLRRGPRWRARAALAQGLFLAALAIGVLAFTLYRTFVPRQPAAEMMGAFSVIALAVNLLSAALLVPFRNGDASARAVWLFSRNDALSNMAVLAAAALVAWTRSPWPDLAAAACIATLFLASARVIIRDARAELRPESPGRSGDSGVR